MTSRRIVVTLGSVVAAVFAAALGTVAWAFFVASGVGAASANVADLPAPASVSATSNGGAVTVTWTDSTPPGGGDVDGYYVERLTGGTPSAACDTSVSSLLPATGNDPTCVDDAPDGTFSYRVTAVWRSWSATSSESDDVVVSGDSAAPDATITFPENSGVYDASDYIAGCAAATAEICGTASDGSGVAAVRVSIKRQLGDLYWDGSGFTSSTETFHGAAVTTAGDSTVTWSYGLPTPSTGGYTVHVQAEDETGQQQTGTTYAAAATFTVDVSAPTVAVEQAAPEQDDPTNTEPVHFVATFSEPVEGFSAVDVTLGGTGVAGATVEVTGSGAVYDISVDDLDDNGSSSTVIASLGAGVVTDVAGNGNEASSSADNEVTYDATPPGVTIARAGGQDEFTNDSPISFTASFSEPVSAFTASDVVVGGTANDAIASVSPSGTASAFTITVAGMTTDGTVTASVASDAGIDAAGNLSTSSNTASVTYDTTAPAISPDIAGTLGGNGWYTSNATVSWNIADAGSGVDFTLGCDPTSITSDSAGQLVTCSATDNAGNSDSEDVTIKRDATPPSISAGSSHAASVWTSQTVTVSYSCSDATSALAAACPSPDTFSTSGTFTAAQVISDQAGNSAGTSFGPIQVDKLAPTGSMTTPTDGSTVGGSVTLASNAADAHSGVQSVAFQVRPGTSGTFTTVPSAWDSTTVANGSYQIQAVITDAVGNSAVTPTIAVTVSNTFAVSAPAAATAGTPVSVTITAKAAGVTDATYTGTRTVTFTGPSSALVGGATPTGSASVSFVNGVGTTSITFVRAETTALTATAANLTGTSGNIVVSGGVASRFYFSACSTTGAGGAATCAVTGTSVTLRKTNQGGGTWTARVSVADAYGNTTTNTSGSAVTVTLGRSTSGTSVSPTTVSIANNASQSSTTFTFSNSGVPNGGGSDTLTASSSGYTQGSAQITW